jgi:hypothetical protein
MEMEQGLVRKRKEPLCFLRSLRLNSLNRGALISLCLLTKMELQ